MQDCLQVVSLPRILTVKQLQELQEKGTDRRRWGSAAEELTINTSDQWSTKAAGRRREIVNVPFCVVSDVQEVKDAPMYNTSFGTNTSLNTHSWIGAFQHNQQLTGQPVLGVNLLQFSVSWVVYLKRTSLSAVWRYFNIRGKVTDWKVFLLWHIHLQKHLWTSHSSEDANVSSEFNVTVD